MTVAGGAPTLTLNDGGTATYTGGSGTDVLTFSYTVASTDTSVSTLAITAVNLPSGVTITDSSGNAANMAGAETSFSGLSVDPPVTVEPSRPSIRSSLETGTPTEAVCSAHKSCERISGNLAPDPFHSSVARKFSQEGRVIAVLGMAATVRDLNRSRRFQLLNRSSSPRHTTL